MGKTEQQSNSMTTREAASLLASIRFSAISATLKENDFVMVTGIAFAGFRVDAKGYSNPIVQQRLAAEAARNELFAARIKQLADDAKELAAQANREAAAMARPVSANRAKEMPTAKPLVSDTRAEEITRLKREKEEESARRREIEAELLAARKEALADKFSRAEHERELERSQQRAQRLDRKLRRAEQTAVELRKLAAVASASEPSAARVRQEQPAFASSAEPEDPLAREALEIVEALRNLLNKPKCLAPIQVSEETLRTAPENTIALEIHAKACESHDIKGAVASWRALLGVLLKRGKTDEAAQCLVNLFRLSPDQKAAKEFFHAASAPKVCLASIRKVFDKTRAVDKETYLSIRKLAQGDALSMLFSPQSGSRPTADSVLPIRLPGHVAQFVTARQIVAGLDQNNEALLYALRRAIENLSEEEMQFVADAFHAASDVGDSYLTLFTRPNLAGPVVVDTMNVAWHGQEMLVSPKPRLWHVIAVRNALRRKGYFPIVLISDANLRYVIDDQSAAVAMIEAGEILLGQSGEDADALILRDAERLGAPVVTNDYMADWDPEQKMLKLQYSIAAATALATIHR